MAELELGTTVSLTRRVSRLEEQVALLRTLLITSKTNEVKWMGRSVERSAHRRLVEAQLLEEERSEAEGELRLLKEQEVILQQLIMDSKWTTTDTEQTDTNQERVEKEEDSSSSTVPLHPPNPQFTKPEPDVQKIFFKVTKRGGSVPESDSLSFPTTTKHPQSSTEEGVKGGASIHKSVAKSVTSSSSAGWIKPKASQQKVSVKNSFSALPTTSSAKTSPPHWVINVTRTECGQKERMKRLKQTTLLDMSRRTQTPATVDLSTLEGYSGGERKVIRFGTARSPPHAPQLPVAGEKRKSIEVEEEDDAFGSEDEDVLGEFPMTAVVQQNKENETEGDQSGTNWDDDTFFGDCALNDVLEPPKEDQGASALPQPSPHKRPGVLCLRNKKKDQQNNHNFRSTQEILRDFDKVPSSSPTKPNFKFKSEKAVRKKAERRQLPGWDCPECKDYWDGVASQLGPVALQKLKDQCSRHRGKHQEAEYEGNTPPLYWRTDFPSTEELPHVDGFRSPPRPKFPSKLN